MGECEGWERYGELLGVSLSWLEGVDVIVYSYVLDWFGLWWWIELGWKELEMNGGLGMFD